MCVYLYICMYTCAHIYVCIYIHTCNSRLNWLCSLMPSVSMNSYPFCTGAVFGRILVRGGRGGDAKVEGHHGKTFSMGRAGIMETCARLMTRFG